MYSELQKKKRGGEALSIELDGEEEDKCLLVNLPYILPLHKTIYFFFFFSQSPIFVPLGTEHTEHIREELLMKI